MCLTVIGGETSSKWRLLFYFVVMTRLSRKTMCTITNKQHNWRCLVLRRNIQHVRAGFALFRVVITGSCVSWKANTLFNSTCSTIHISNNLLYFFVHTQFFLSILGPFKWDNFENLFVGYQVPFFSKEKAFLSVFVVFACSCNAKVTLWTNNQALRFPQPLMDLRVVT